jgi:hypothetical protein
MMHMAILSIMNYKVVIYIYQKNLKLPQLHLVFLKA